MKEMFKNKNKRAINANVMLTRAAALLIALIMIFGISVTAFDNRAVAAIESDATNAYEDSNITDMCQDIATEYNEADDDATTCEYEYEYECEYEEYDDENIDEYISDEENDESSSYVLQNAIRRAISNLINRSNLLAHLIDDEIDLNSDANFIGIVPFDIYTFWPYVIIDRGEVYLDDVANVARITNVRNVQFRHNVIHTEAPGMRAQHRTQFNGIFNEWTELNADLTPPELYSFTVPIENISNGIHVLGIEARRQFDEWGIIDWQSPRSSTIFINVQRTNSFVHIQGGDVIRYNRDVSTAINRGQAGFGHEPGRDFVNESSEPGRQIPVNNPSTITVGRVDNTHPFDGMLLYGDNLPANHSVSYWSITGPNINTGNIPLTDETYEIDLINDPRFINPAFTQTNVSLFVPGAVYTVRVRVHEETRDNFPSDPNIWSYSEATFRFDPPTLEKSVSEDEAELGDEVTYTLTIDNTSNNLTFADILVRDELDPRVSILADTIEIALQSGAAVAGATHNSGEDGVLEVHFLTLPPEIIVISFDVRIWCATAAGQNIPNIAYLLGPPDGNGDRPIIDEDDDDFDVPGRPWLAIEKLVNGENSIVSDVGNVLTYSIVVRNTGTAKATDFFMIDNLSHLIDAPYQRIYNVRNLGATATGGIVGDYEIIDGEVVRVEILELNVGGYVTITFQATVHAYAVGSTFTNIAILSRDEDGDDPKYNTEWEYCEEEGGSWQQERDPDTGENVYIEDDATKNVPYVPYERVPNPEMSILKRVNNVPTYTMQNADTVLRYTIAVTNISEYDATGFRVVDDLSRLIGTYLANFTLADVSIPSGATASLDAGRLTVILGTVAPGETVTITIETRLHEGLTLNGQRFNNTAILFTPDGDEEDRSTATVIVPTIPEEGEGGDGGGTGGGNRPLPKTGIDSYTGIWATLLIIMLLVIVRVAMEINKRNNKLDVFDEFMLKHKIN